MSGYIPVALSLTELPRFDQKLFGTLMMYLRREWRMQNGSSEPPWYRLTFEADTGEWTGIESLPVTLTTQQLLEEVRWFRFDYSVEIGEERAFVEMYTFAGAVPGRVRLEFKLGSRVHEAVYAHDEDLKGWDEEAKQALVDFCLGVAQAVGAAGFVLDHDDGELSPLTVEEARRRMRDEENVPVMELWELHKAGKPIKHLKPGMITALKRQYVSIEELRTIWKPARGVYELPPDYVVLDFLRPPTR